MLESLSIAIAEGLF